MTIRKRAGRILILGAVAALMAGAGAAPALATDVVFNVSPGGSFGGPLSSPAVTISDTATGTTITCPTSLVKGVITGGTGLSGTHLGRLVFVSFGGCVDSAASVTFTVTGPSTTHPWWFNATSFAAGVTTATISGMHLRLQGSNGCVVVADHTGPGSFNGKAIGHYTNGTPPTLQIQPVGPGLRAFPNAACNSGTPATPVNASDPITIAATYHISNNPQTIT
jgi:hypothetical protein